MPDAQMTSPSPEHWSRQLRASAAKRMQAALNAYIDRDPEEVAAEAPRAVELLGKAALWNLNPVLLAPLGRDSEAALIALATNPRLDSAALRTITLGEVLTRVAAVFTHVSIAGDQKNRLLACRNGAMHVGTLPKQGESSGDAMAQKVLAHSIQICDDLLDTFDGRDRDPHSFYGRHGDRARTLVAERRDQNEREVSARVAACARDFENMRLQISDHAAFHALNTVLASRSVDLIDDVFLGSELESVERSCPACHLPARLGGYLDVEGEADVQIEEGRAVVQGHWAITLHPTVFMCHVCNLALHGPDELVAAGLPATAMSGLHESDLGAGFSAADWVEDEYFRTALDK